MLEGVDIDKILISTMVSASEKFYKYFIGDKEVDYKTKLFCIMLPKPVHM